MKTSYAAGSIWHIARADFLERVRSYSFLIALGLCIFMIYSFVPPLDAAYKIISLGNYRGFYNSAWIGCMVAMCVPFFTLVGFYVVNYSVRRDIDTGVGQIIAATRITRLQYLTGKLISNFMVLLVITLLIAVMTTVMFFFRAETGHPEFGKLLLPLFIFLIPSMFIVATIALILDSFGRLSRGTINIIWFFIWMFLISASLLINYLDIFGMASGMNEIKHSLLSIHPDWDGNFGVGIGFSDPHSKREVFIWDGTVWTTRILLSRIFWMTVFFGLVLISTIGFDRFDTSKINVKDQGDSWWLNRKSVTDNDISTTSNVRYRDLPPATQKFSYPGLIQAELRLMLKGHSGIWMLITCALFIVSIFASLDFAYEIVLPLLWFFQILILSNLGSREVTHRCQEYIFSVALPMRRQLPATIAASVLFMLTLAIPVIIKVSAAGNLYGAYAIFVGALFIPVLAITLGILTGGSKIFEVIFTIMAYFILERIPYVDFIGSVKGSRELGITHYILGLTIVLIVLGFQVRKMQIKNPL